MMSQLLLLLLLLLLHDASHIRGSGLWRDDIGGWQNPGCRNRKRFWRHV